MFAIFLYNMNLKRKTLPRHVLPTCCGKEQLSDPNHTLKEVGFSSLFVQQIEGSTEQKIEIKNVLLSALLIWLIWNLEHLFPSVHCTERPSRRGACSQLPRPNIGGRWYVSGQLDVVYI